VLTDVVAFAVDIDRVRAVTGEPPATPLVFDQRIDGGGPSGAGRDPAVGRSRRAVGSRAGHGAHSRGSPV